VGGEIRIGIGRCLRTFAYVGLLFGLPVTAFLMSAHIPTPVGLVTLVACCAGMILVGVVVGRWGEKAKRRYRYPDLNASIQRAMWQGRAGR
jgi:hypothetical protein